MLERAVSGLNRGYRAATWFADRVGAQLSLFLLLTGGLTYGGYIRIPRDFGDEIPYMETVSIGIPTMVTLLMALLTVLHHLHKPVAPQPVKVVVPPAQKPRR
jgi:hypothetical protein